MRVGLTLALSGVLGLALGLAITEVAASAPPVDLRAAVDAKLPQSGLEHPVSAVLLNFRSYDTLLEIAVLVVAAVIGLSLSDPRALEVATLRTSDELLYALVRWFVPLSLVLAAYLVWAGTARPGGAFQAGAVLAGAGVLMRLSGIPTQFLQPGLMLRLGLVLGFAVFLVVALFGAVAGTAFLAYPAGYAKPLIFVVELLLTLSIGMILLGLFVSAPISERRSGHRATGAPPR
jgi:multisubunit Na+/H+ antiporter MnhB subunit